MALQFAQEYKHMDRSGLFSSVSVFLFFAVSLVVPSGYSLGAALLFGAGLTLLVRPAQWPTLGKQEKLLLLVWLAFFLTWIAEIVLDGQALSRYDKPVRILCAGVALLWLLKHPPKPWALWAGAASGATMVGAWAAWQKLVLHVDRAGGHTHLIQFGNISMLLGMLCLAGMGWAWIERRSWRWTLFLLLGFCCGVLGSLFSGSRGGWVGVPFILLVVLHGYSRHLSRKLIAGALVAGLLAACTVFFIPKTGVQGRVQAAISDVKLYYGKDVTTSSLGARFEMWRFGLRALAERPLTGFGQQGLRDYKAELIKSGDIAKIAGSFDHLHNEYIDTAARRGLIGLLALLAVYLVPFRLFSARASDAAFDSKPYAVAGAILCVSYMDFGLSQSFFSHNSGVMVYFFAMAILWALMTSSRTNNKLP